MKVLLFLVAILALISNVSAWTLCPNAANHFAVSNVALNVNRPAISIEVDGKLDSQVTGGNLLIDVKLAGVHLYSETDPLDGFPSLPIGPGDAVYKHTVNIPSIAPPGSYTVDLTFKDQSGNALTCVEVLFKL